LAGASFFISALAAGAAATAGVTATAGAAGAAGLAAWAKAPIEKAVAIRTAAIFFMVMILGNLDG
jgi:hypothetical protein